MSDAEMREKELRELAALREALRELVEWLDKYLDNRDPDDATPLAALLVSSERAREVLGDE